VAAAVGSVTALLNPPEVAEARTWLTKAAESGHTKAQYNLGLLLAFMMDPPELTEAGTWWIRAARAGDADARRLLRQIQDA
jgi:TPR repeat protein